jgi:hypothetical protein
MAKSKYQETIKKNWEWIKSAVRNGSTDKVIYTKLKISYDTYYRYLNEFPEFSEMIKNERKISIEEVEDALFKSATGKVSIKKTKKYKTVDSSGKETQHIEEVVEEVPPNITAIIFYLQNRNSGSWQSRPIENFIAQNRAKIEKALAVQQTGMKLEDINFDFCEINDDDKRKNKKE